MDALTALKTDSDFYNKPMRDLPLVMVGDKAVPKCSVIWRQMAVDVGSRNQPDWEKAQAIKNFIQEVHDSGWPEYTLIRAFKAHRRKGTGFMPTHGQLHAAMTEAGQIGGTRHYEELMGQLQKICGQAKRRDIEPPKNTIEERRAHIEKLKADKARGFSIKSDGGHRAWLPIDDRLLKNLERNLEKMEA